MILAHIVWNIFKNVSNYTQYKAKWKEMMIQMVQFVECWAKISIFSTVHGLNERSYNNRKWSLCILMVHVV